MKLEVTEHDIHVMAVSVQSWSDLLHECLDDKELKKTDPDNYEEFERKAYLCERLYWKLETLSCMFYALKATTPGRREMYLVRMREAEQRYGEMTA